MWSFYKTNRKSIFNCIIFNGNKKRTENILQVLINIKEKKNEQRRQSAMVDSDQKNPLDSLRKETTNIRYSFYCASKVFFSRRRRRLSNQLATVRILLLFALKRIKPVKFFSSMAESERND